MKSSDCHRCGLAGRMIAVSFTRDHRHKWIVLRCENPDCVFTMRGADMGRPGDDAEFRARAKWMIPAREYQQAK